MPAERVTMRKIKDILRLKWACGLSNRQVAASCGVARSTVAETLYRATAAGLSWPLPEDLDDAQLETRLYPAAPSPTSPPRAMPEWATVHQELTRKGVTLALLWQEYKASSPTAISTAAFAISMAPGGPPWIGVYGRSIGPARNSSSIMRARPCRSRTGRPANFGRPRSSSPSGARRTTPTPRRPGRKRCPIGSGRMSGRFAYLAACRRSSCPTTCAAASPRPVGMNRS
jgi:hypothetical protein